MIRQSILRERNRLAREKHSGEFWKPCPGTGGGYLCCGYQILTPLTGCGMYCSYCALHAYFDRQHQVLFTNFHDLEKEVHDKMRAWEGRVLRLGTGEFADSLFLEPKLGLSKKIAQLLAPYPNVLVEFKTKSDRVETLRRIKEPRKVVIGFSLNTGRNVRLFEKGTSSITARLKAARRCEEMGFWVAFHFDPMIWYAQWEREYRELVDRIFGVMRDPGRIAWWSLGGFRSVPSLKRLLEKTNSHVPLFSGEMVMGEDRKLRYFRPIRVEFYRAMQEQVTKHCPETTLYLCMESRDVWQDADMLKRIPQGLPAYLDERARQMLGI